VEIYRDAVGEWRWRIKAANGRTLADSGEGYEKRTDCEQGLEVVRLLSEQWPMERIA
jgi:uncharacterized protein YegP (UPF0339 family)